MSVAVPVPMDESFTPRTARHDSAGEVAEAAATTEASNLQPLSTQFQLEGGDENKQEGEESMTGGPDGRRAKYLKELELCQMLGQIREKPEWWLKVNQPLILNRWKKEMYEQATLLTPQTIEYGIQELKYQSQLYQQTSLKGHTILSTIDGIYQNDQLISTGLLQQLKDCLKLFEEVPVSERDYHPDKKVINLVDPSLYCLRIGQTKLTKEPIPLKDTLRSIGSGEIVSQPPVDGVEYATSKNYAWLPAEFEVSSDGSKVKINSYINNIHLVQHAKLYEVLADIFAPFIPMFEKVLQNLETPIPTRMNDNGYYWLNEPKVEAAEVVAFQAHLAQERAALKSASNGQAKFYLDVVQNESFLTKMAQRQATIDLGLQMHPALRLSKSAQAALIQFEDRLARLYLETTFEAYIKTEGLLIGDHQITSDSNFNQPPFVGLYAPDGLLNQLTQLLVFAHKAIAKAVIKSVTNPTGGVVFTKQMARRWVELFKRQLPKLYPQMSPTTIEQYCQLFLRKDLANLIRLSAAIDYFTAEIVQFAGEAAMDFQTETIELFHVNLVIGHDPELHALNSYLHHINATEVDDENVEEEDEPAAPSSELTKVVNETTTPAVEVVKESAPSSTEEEKNATAMNENEEVKEQPLKIYQPEVMFPFSPEACAPKSTISLAGRTLQVIVKLENIELTPEMPIYPGGSWHVEGMKNESIVATGIYYISGTNIMDSPLSFRQHVLGCRPTSQADWYGSHHVYGGVGDFHQELGSLMTKSERAITFPNIYQNRVQPCQLADSTKPGKRQILVFFLVDPTIRVISTANVPPQQQHWLKTATGDQTPTVLSHMNTVTSLIPDLVQLTGEYTDLGVISPEHACGVREEFMKERNLFVDQQFMSTPSLSSGVIPNELQEAVESIIHENDQVMHENDMSAP